MHSTPFKKIWHAMITETGTSWGSPASFSVTIYGYQSVTIQEISDEVVIPDLFDILPSLGCYLHDQSGHEKVEIYLGDMDERWHVQELWSQSISNTRPPDSQPNRVVERPDNE